MWRAATKSVVMAVAMVGLGTGCDLASILNQIADQIGQPNDPTEPGDPDRPDEPGDVDPGDPTDPGIFCEEALNDCLNAGVDEQVCVQDFEICLDDTRPVPPIDPNDPWLVCELELEQCLDGVYTQGFPVDLPWPGPEEGCFLAYDACIGDVFPPPPPVDECEIELQECLENVWSDPGDPQIQIWPVPGEEECFVRYDACLGWTEPPPPQSPCDELIGLCLQTGVDPQLCDEVYSQCVANGPDEPPCDLPLPYEDGDPGDEDDGTAY
ncbi:MAG: hypothetical protein R3F61_22560 [Myxococcota bacterium]